MTTPVFEPISLEDVPKLLQILKQLMPYSTVVSFYLTIVDIT